MIKIYDGRTEFFQWDLDRKIVISDPTVDEVHFCNRTGECSLVTEVYELDGQRVANVPNIILQNNWPIRVYLYCNKCYTKESVTFNVVARTRPDTYVYTETQVKTWESLNEAVTEKLELVDDKLISLDELEASLIETETIRESNEAIRVANEEARIQEFNEFKTESAALLEDLDLYDDQVENHEKRITNIEEAINPNYVYEDNSIAYLKAAPINAAKYAELEIAGTLTHKVEQTLIEVKPNELIINGRNLFDINREDYFAAKPAILPQFQPKVEDGILYSGGKTGVTEGGIIPTYLLPNTDYTISFDYSTTDAQYNVIVFLRNDTNPHSSSDRYTVAALSPTSNPSKTGHYSKTFNSENYTVAGLIAYSTNQYGLKLSNIQIEIGTVATEYKPYIEPINMDLTPFVELDGYGLGIDEATYNYIDLDKKVFVQNAAKYTFTGNETWSGPATTTKGLYRYYATVVNEMKKHNKGHYQNGLCDKFATMKSAWNYETVEGIRFGQANNAIYLYLENSITAAEVQTLTAGMTIVYPLEEPVITDISEQLAEFDNLIEAGSVEFVNEDKLGVPSVISYLKKGGNA